MNTIWGGTLLSRRVGTGLAATSTFYTFDPQGNVAQRLDASANVLGVYAFDAYGLRTATDTTTDPYAGFEGGWGYYADAETGLSLLGHRYYDTGTGRFVTRDPIGYDGGINLYRYTQNNPVNRSDPSGLMPPFALAGGGVVTSGAVAGEGGLAVAAIFWPVAAVGAAGAVGYGLGTLATALGNHIANGFHAQDGLPAPPMNIGKAVNSPRQAGLPVGDKCPYPYVPAGKWKPGMELPGRPGRDGQPEYEDASGNFWKKGPPHHFPGDPKEWDVTDPTTGKHINVGIAGGGARNAGVVRGGDK